LVDSAGNEVGWRSGAYAATANSVTSIKLRFSGEDILPFLSSGGRFTLRDLSVFNNTGTTSAVFDNIITTQNFVPCQFESGECKVWIPTLMSRP